MSNLVAMNRQEFEAYIEHYGKKGMKWGVRQQFSKQNRALNKASRQKDLQKHEKEVKRARELTKSPTFFRNTSKSALALKKAKSEHTENKMKLGSREANKILNKAREKHSNNIRKSGEYANGKEAAFGLIAEFGSLAFKLRAA